MICELLGGKRDGERRQYPTAPETIEILSFVEPTERGRASIRCEVWERVLLRRSKSYYVQRI